MRPKNELENRMIALAEKLPPITDKQCQYAYEHCFSSKAIVYKRRKGEVRCLCCNHTAKLDKATVQTFFDIKKYECPNCHQVSRIEYSDVEPIERRNFTILTTFRGYQVARTFEVCRHNPDIDMPTQYSINEAYQNWITDDGKEIITGHPSHRSPFYLVWDIHKPYEIRQHNASCTGSFAMNDLFDISDNHIYPEVRVTPLIKRNGWTPELLEYGYYYSLTDLMRLLLTSPFTEMLVKTKQFGLLQYMMRLGDKTLPFLHAIRIANRNRYIIDYEYASMWFDMLTMAAELGRDTHNPKIVCPDNLRSAHDALLKPVTRKREKEQAERNLKRMLDWEIKYKESKTPYFGVCFGNDEIKITVIQSVADMKAEGDAMHHCVFNAQYYRKDDSLILSARNNAGKRIETIELSLKTFEVIQSRGYCNKLSKHHDEIVQLVEKNINLFKQIKSKTA